jgi:AraC-like DNA-binding protein
MTGVLHGRRAEGGFQHARYLPADELRLLIDCYWSVHWDLRDQPRRLAETLPHPCVHWVTELGRSAIRGIGTRRFQRWLEGKGRVCGVRFRPGGFRPLLGAPVSALTDGSVSLRRVFGAAGTAIGRALCRLDRTAAEGAARRGEWDRTLDDRTDEEMMDLIDAFLLERLPRDDRRLAVVSEIVGAIQSSPELTRVGLVADRFGMTVRSLQRLFGEYVGVSPKWVIQRYRIHEVLARLDAGRVVDWARLAVELGYFDQAHFIKDFKALTGRSPGQYELGADGRSHGGRRDKT